MSRSAVWKAAAVVYLAFYAFLLVRANCFVAGGSDSSGYLNFARLLARGEVTERIDALRELGLDPSDRDLFVPLGYRAGWRPGTMTPTYSPGLPLHMAVLGSLGGWDVAPFLAVPILAIASLVLFYLVARELGLSRALASAGVVLLSSCSTFFGMAIQPMSDVPATAWVLAAIFFALRARRRPAWAFAAGAAFGVAVFVRPTNALAGLALLFALPRGGRALGRAVAGGLPFAGLLLGYNALAFGSITETGYAGHWRKMSPSHVPTQIAILGSWIARLLTPLVPLAWLGVGFDRRVPARDRWLLLSWFGAFLAFFLFNEVLEDWWVTRYLLPGFPALYLAALFLARDLAEWLGRTARLRDLPRWKSAAGVALLLLVVAVGVRHMRRFELAAIHRAEEVYPEAALWAGDAVPANGLIAGMQMSGAVKYYTGRPVVRWDWVPAERFPALRRVAEERGRRWYALLWPFEEADAFRHLPGSWTRVGARRHVTLWRLD